MKDYRCSDCGRPCQSKRKNAKYCHICRLLRNFQYLGTKSRECWQCSGRYVPVERNDVICGKCAIPRNTATQGECVLCDKERPLYNDDVRVCLPCMRDPDKREALWKALGSKQREHLDAYGHLVVR